MKMNSKSWLAAGMIAAVLTACNKEEELEQPAGNQQEEIPGEGAYIQIQVVGPTGGFATKTTAGEDNVENGTDAENGITSLTVLLCSSDDHKVVQRFYLSGTDLSEITVGNQGNAGYPGYQTPQMKLDENVTVDEDGTLYEIYVIANDKGALSESYYPATVQENTLLSEAYIGDGGVYAGAISQELMKTDYAAAGKFLMFNECNGNGTSHGTGTGGETTPADKCGTFITIRPENVYDNPATCPLIRLDRMAVKITSDAKNSAGTATTIDDIADAIRYDSDNDGTTEQHTKGITAVTLKGFKLLNGAEKVYLQQHWTNTSDGQNQTGGTVYPYTNTLITPAMTAASETGTDTDNYYNTLSDFRTLTTKAVSGNYSPEYTAVVDKYDLDGSPAYYDQTNPTGPIYCMENNPTYDASAASANPLYYKEALIGNTTGLVYQWQATLADGLSDEAAGENCFYSYGDKYYGRLADIQKDFPAVFDPATTAAPQNNWETLEKLTGITVDSQDAANLAQAMTELRAARAIEVPDDRQGAISDWRIEYNIRVYTDGLMYYLYFIKDENYRQIQSDEPSAQPEQYYSVMRNTVYKLNITSLGAIGTDIPGGWNPDVIEDNPVDDTSLYMQVEVQANPWVVSQTDITLK